MKNKYKNPPIKEAVCEFRFNTSSPWDMAIPGLIYDKVKKQFPKRKQVKRLDLNILTIEDSFSPQVTAINEIRFLQENERVFLAVSPYMLSAHIQESYSSWTDFLPLIKSGFNTYCQITDPNGLNRIGLRYINNIKFDKKEIDLEDYFEFRPHMGQNMNQNYHSFNLNIEQAFENKRDNLKIQLKNEKGKEPHQIAIVLDFDYSLQRPGQVSLHNVFDWVDVAHTRIYETFEACITEKLRKTFKPENS